MAVQFCINSRNYNILVLDFETYYANDYSLSLSTYSTSAYIRDPQFRAHGVGVYDGIDKRWVSHDQLVSYFASIDWENTAVICHNALFDCYVLAYHYGVIPGFIIDTAGMSRQYWGVGYMHSLDQLSKRYNLAGKIRAGNLQNTKGIRVLPPELEDALAVYCIDDCVLTYTCFTQMYRHVPDLELRLIDLTTRLFCQSPLKVNEALATEELEAERASKQTALSAANVDIQELMSNDKFARLLASIGYDPPTKTSARTGKTTWAFAKTDPEFQLMLESDDVVIRTLAEARLAAKSTIGETRAERFIAEGCGGKRIPVGLTYCAAKTHRWGGTNKMNFQNLPRAKYLPSGELIPSSARLRRSLEVDDGYMLVVRDSSQIEVRTLAWWAGQDDLVDDFKNKVDIYKKMASRVFNVPIDEVTKPQRFIGKVLILGLGYGMSAAKLLLTLALGLMGDKVNITPGEAQTYVTIYRTTYLMITHAWRIGERMIHAMVSGTRHEHKGVVATKDVLSFPNGTRIAYRNIRMSSTGEFIYDRGNTTCRIYGASLVENIIQKLARDVIAEQIIRVADLPYRPQIVTMTHDEIVACTTTDMADKLLSDMGVIMATPPTWCVGIPLDSEGGYAQNYSK